MREINLNNRSLNIVDENIKKLRELFPEIVVEGNVDFERLQDILGKYIERNEESYRFSWHGKGDAFRKAQTPSTGTLRPYPDDAESKNWDTTQNLYIEGDNLEVLKLLQKSYGGKVKMIYIDPPYNVDKDKAFIYSDKWSDPIKGYKIRTGQVDDDGLATTSEEDTQGGRHSNWLNMIYPRLRLARHLLTDDGVIFISIDDIEVHNLRKVCDEIFGEENFITSLTWQKRKGGGNDSHYIAVDHDYILVYAKSVSGLTTKWRIKQTEKYLKRYKEVDGDGRKYYWDTLSRDGLQNPIIIDIQAPDGTNIIVNSQKSEQAVLEGINNGSLRFTKSKNGWSLHHKVYMPEGQVMRSILQNCGTNKSAGEVLCELFGFNCFDYSKPVELVESFLQLNNTSSAIILDFFSGSATTAHAVMKLNAEDGGNRKFMMVQLPDLVDKKEHAESWQFLHDLGKPENICEIGKERIRRAGEKVKAELKEKYDAYKKKQATVANMLEDEEEKAPMNPDDLDIGFKVFKLDSSNLERWTLDVGDDFDKLDKDKQNEIISSKLGLQVNNFVDGREDIDMLYEVMLKYGLDLSLPIDTYTFDKKNVYCIGAGALFVSFADELDESFADAIVAKVKELEPATVRVVVKDLAFIFDDRKTNFRETLKTGIAHYFAESNNSNKENQFEFITI